jgi:hypothetical protein
VPQHARFFSVAFHVAAFISGFAPSSTTSFSADANSFLSIAIHLSVISYKSGKLPGTIVDDGRLAGKRSHESEISPD